ncbi:MAG: hypothetical protein RLZZ511_2266 [Cyanobacteriota bacterium]|jgi:Family of unknown function (DUF6492)
MPHPAFGLITPSYAPDFQRCQLLSATIAQYLRPPFTHYIVVDRCDLPLFATLANAHTEILTVEAIVPGWIGREPMWRKFWVSGRAGLVRNWILQQTVKIALAQQIPEDVAVFVDSDVAFVRSLDLTQFVAGSRVRLYRDDMGNIAQRDYHRPWHQVASRLLNIPMNEQYIPDYIGNLITWRRDHVVQLCQHLEAQSGRSWFATLAREWQWSEYILYGLFVDRVLGDRSQHYTMDLNPCHDYWFPQPLADEALRAWIGQMQPEHVAVMISAKSGMNVDRYARLLENQSVTEFSPP